MVADVVKPAYRVPLMSEIRSIPWNGLRVASTFSGAGGSSLGYRMAGCKVVWASEFVDRAQETYLANCGGDTFLNTQDIRDVTSATLLGQAGVSKGELDILDGSPPCASFSSAGLRSQGWGKQKAYSGKVQRVDDLFFQFARILEGVKPKVFVAENVSGLIKGKAKGYFKEIMQELTRAGYRVKVKLLDAKWMGVPQSRKRLIFIGVRTDLDMDPIHPEPLPYCYSVKDAVPWIWRFQKSSFVLENTWYRAADDSMCTITEGDGCSDHRLHVEAERDLSGYELPDYWDNTMPNVYPKAGSRAYEVYDFQRTSLPANKETDLELGRRRYTIGELKRICSFPDDFIVTGSYRNKWARLGRAVPPLMMKSVASTITSRMFGV